MLHDHFVATYHADPEDWGTIAYFRIDAHWLVAFDFGQSPADSGETPADSDPPAADSDPPAPG
jgi:hypothetical protein